MHRDLKLENLLLASPDEITKVGSAMAQHLNDTYCKCAVQLAAAISSL